MQIDRLYVITTNTNTDRFRKFLRETVAGLAIPVEIVDAVTPETLTIDVEAKAKEYDSLTVPEFDRISLTRRGQDLRHVQLECSCSASHAKAMKLAINRQEIALILEDDAICIDTDFSHLDDLPEDWDVFYVTHSFYANRHIVNNDLKAEISHAQGSIYRVRGTALTTTGYIVNGKSKRADGLIALRKRWKTGSVPDLSISYCSRYHGLNVYLSSKRNFWHDDAVFQSTLTTPQTQAFADKYLDILRIGQTFDIDQLSKITSYTKDSIVLYVIDNSNRDLLEDLFRTYQYDRKLYRVVDVLKFELITDQDIRNRLLGYAYHMSTKERYVSEVVYSKELTMFFFSWQDLHEQYTKSISNAN